jgi:hypothetical protein
MTIASESLMIDPIRRALESLLPRSVWVQEYRSGYGIADLVGMVVSERARSTRRICGQSILLNSRRSFEVLALLQPDRSLSLHGLARRTALSGGSVRRILSLLLRSGFAVETRRQMYRLAPSLPHPASEIIAVEAKIERWSKAILQARRYSLFANRTYVAISSSTVKRVDRAFLYRHRIGLIAVNRCDAHIVVPAPMVRPRSFWAHRACAERLYSLAES